MIEIVEQIVLPRVNYRFILKKEDIGVPLVANKLCLLEGFLVVCPIAAVDKYRQAMLVDSRQFPIRFAIGTSSPPDGGASPAVLRSCSRGTMRARGHEERQFSNLPLIMIVEESLHWSGLVFLVVRSGIVAGALAVGGVTVILVSVVVTVVVSHGVAITETIPVIP